MFEENIDLDLKDQVHEIDEHKHLPSDKSECHSTKQLTSNMPTLQEQLTENIQAPQSPKDIGELTQNIINNNLARFDEHLDERGDQLDALPRYSKDQIGDSSVCLESNCSRPKKRSRIRLLGVKAKSMDEHNVQSNLRRKFPAAARAINFIRQATDSMRSVLSSPGSRENSTTNSNKSMEEFQETNENVDEYEMEYEREFNKPGASLANDRKSPITNSYNNIDCSAENDDCNGDNYHEYYVDSNQLHTASPSNKSYGGILHERSELDAFWFQSEFPIFMIPRLNDLSLPLCCRILSVDGELIREIFIHRYETGQHLIDDLLTHTGMSESRFFGLKLIETRPEDEDLRSPWIELTDPVIEKVKNRAKQLRKIAAQNKIMIPKCPKYYSTRSIDIMLRFRYYPKYDYIRDPFMRGYLYLQLRRDMRSSKLISSSENMAKLTAFTLQLTFGNFRQELIQEVGKMNIFPGQKLVENLAIDIWRTKMHNLTRSQVLTRFLRASMMLETYGCDLYPVKHHQKSTDQLLGFNFAGIKTIGNNRVLQDIRWEDVHKVCSENKIVIIHHINRKDVSKKMFMGFKCQSVTECHLILQRILDHKYFFTLDLKHFDCFVGRKFARHLESNSSSRVSLNQFSRSSSAYNMHQSLGTESCTFPHIEQQNIFHTTNPNQDELQSEINCTEQKRPSIPDTYDPINGTRYNLSKDQSSEMDLRETLHDRNDLRNSNFIPVQGDIDSRSQIDTRKPSSPYLNNQVPNCDLSHRYTSELISNQAVNDGASLLIDAGPTTHNPGVLSRTQEYNQFRSRLVEFAEMLIMDRVTHPQSDSTTNQASEAINNSNVTVKFSILSTCVVCISVALVWFGMELATKTIIDQLAYNNNNNNNEP